MTKQSWRNKACTFCHPLMGQWSSNGLSDLSPYRGLPVSLSPHSTAAAIAAPSPPHACRCAVVRYYPCAVLSTDIAATDPPAAAGATHSGGADPQSARRLGRVPPPRQEVLLQRGHALQHLETAAQTRQVGTSRARRDGRWCRQGQTVACGGLNGEPGCEVEGRLL